MADNEYKFDPENVEHFDATYLQLEWFFIFCVAVQGKNSTIAARALNTLYALANGNSLVQAYATEPDTVMEHMVDARIGNYTRMAGVLKHLPSIDLRKATLQELLDIPGVGNKTARFFLLNTRPGVRHAVLDVHVLRWMNMVRDASQYPALPETTPSCVKKYGNIERKALEMFDKHFPKMPLRQIDMLIWASMSGRLNTEETK